MSETPIHPHKQTEYAGGAFHRHDRTFGSLSADASGLRFQSADETLTFPLQDLTIEAGGANDKTLFFTHPAFPKKTLFTTDQRILKNPFLNQHASLNPEISRILRAQTRSRLFLAGFLLVSLGAIASLFLFKETLVQAAADRIPPSWEEKLGQAALTRIQTGKEFISDPEIRNRIMKIAEPIFEKLPDRRYDFRVFLVRDSQINAFALPGGIIVLHSGLILSATAPEQVAGVLAHETAHVTLRHGLRQIIGSVGLFALVQALFGDVSGLMAILIDNSALLLTRKYSRDYEREADEAGWGYLAAAGIDPRGMTAFFDLLLQEKAGDPSGDSTATLGDALSYLSTHPAASERIDRLRKKWRESNFRPGDFLSLDLDFQNLQDRIRRLK